MKLILSFLSIVGRFFIRIRGAFPRQLPQGMTEQNALIDRLMSTYSLPSSAKDDIGFVVSGTVLRLSENTCYKSDWYFVSVIKSVAAKQVAGAMFSSIKERQKSAAATANLKAVPADVKPI